MSISVEWRISGQSVTRLLEPGRPMQNGYIDQAAVFRGYPLAVRTDKVRSSPVVPS